MFQCLFRTCCLGKALERAKDQPAFCGKELLEAGMKPANQPMYTASVGSMHEHLLVPERIPEVLFQGIKKHVYEIFAQEAV